MESASQEIGKVFLLNQNTNAAAAVVVGLNLTSTAVQKARCAGSVALRFQQYGSVMFQTDSLKSLIAAITAPTNSCTESGDVIETRSADHRQVGNVVWELRDYLVNGYRMWSDIICHEVNGATWRTYREYPTMPHVSCPLEFIDVPWASVCFEWRQRVYDWHEAELAKQSERKST